MVQIGTIEYEAKVTGAGEAQSKTDDLQESQEELGETTQESAASMNRFAGTVRETGDAAEDGGRQIGILDHDMRQLRSTSKGLLGTLGGLFGAGGMLSGGGGGGGSFLTDLALFEGAKKLAGRARGLGGRLVTWIAAGLNAKLGGTIIGSIANALGMSSAALVGAGALGAAIGGTIVAGLHATGVMDEIESLGGDVRGALGGGITDAFLAASSPVFGPIATFGGFINGFVTGTMEGGIINGVEQGFAEAGEVAMTFINAWGRTLENTLGMTEQDSALWTLNEIASGRSENVDNAARDAGENFRESNPGMAETIHTGFTNNPVHDAGEAVGNWEYTGIASGGMIEEPGIAEVHKGEAVIPRPLVEAAKGGTGGGGGGDTIIDVGDVVLKITDPGFDPSDMSRREINDLADRLVRAMGKKTSNIAGTR